MIIQYDPGVFGRKLAIKIINIQTGLSFDEMCAQIEFTKKPRIRFCEKLCWTQKDKVVSDRKAPPTVPTCVNPESS